MSEAKSGVTPRFAPLNAGYDCRGGTILGLAKSSTQPTISTTSLPLPIIPIPAQDQRQARIERNTRPVAERFELRNIGTAPWRAPRQHGGRLDRDFAPGDRGEAVLRLQQKLQAYGYGLEITGEYNEETGFAVAAFQRHFRPALVDGRADRSTLETLDALLEAPPAA